MLNKLFKIHKRKERKKERKKDGKKKKVWSDKVSRCLIVIVVGSFSHFYIITPHFRNLKKERKKGREKRRRRGYRAASRLATVEKAQQPPQFPWSTMGAKTFSLRLKRKKRVSNSSSLSIREARDTIRPIKTW